METERIALTSETIDLLESVYNRCSDESANENTTYDEMLRDLLQQVDEKKREEQQAELKRDQKIKLSKSTLDRIDDFWRMYTREISGLPVRFGNAASPYDDRVRALADYAIPYMENEQVTQERLNEMDSLNLENNFWYWDSGGINPKPETDEAMEKWYRNRMPYDFVGSLYSLANAAESLRVNADMDDIDTKYPYMSNMTKERYLTLTNLFSELDHIVELSDAAYSAWHGEYD